MVPTWEGRDSQLQGLEAKMGETRARIKKRTKEVEILNMGFELIDFLLY
jgi:hypothetical protein